MDKNSETVGNTDSGASSGAEGWKDVLQLLKEQNDKMEKLARALSVIQQGMLRNNPRHVTDSVNEATEAMKKLGIFQRPRSASLGDTPKNQVKGAKRPAPSTPLEKTPKRGKGGSSPSYAEMATSQPPNKEGDWHVVTKKRQKKDVKEKKKKKKEKRRKGQRTLRKKRRGPPPLLSQSALPSPGRAMSSRCRQRTVSPTPTS